MKDFVRKPGRLYKMPVGAKVVYTAYLLFFIAGLYVAAQLYQTGPTLEADGAAAYYAGSDAAEQARGELGSSEVASGAPEAAAPAVSPGPALDLPPSGPALDLPPTGPALDLPSSSGPALDLPPSGPTLELPSGPTLELPSADGAGAVGAAHDLAAYRPPYNSRRLMEVTHGHLFVMPIVLLIVAHLFMLVGLPTRISGAWVGLATIAMGLHIAGPWLVLANPARWAWVMSASGVAMGITLGGMALATLWAMWWPRQKTSAAAVISVVVAGCGATPSSGGDTVAVATEATEGETPTHDAPTFRYEETRFQMGTVVQIRADVRDTHDLAPAFDAIDEVVAHMSEWDEDTDISRLNAAAPGAPVVVDESLIEVVREAIRVAEASDGAFDPSWAALREVWCFTEGCEPPTEQAVAEALPVIDYEGIQIGDGTLALNQEGMALGLGGIAKGYAIAEAVESLRRQGVSDFVVDAGGDVYAAGTDTGAPWRVGIQHPRAREVVDVIELRDAVLVTSGDYQRYIELDGTRYHHLLDPRTGWPARHHVSVSVVAEDPTVADALATAAFILPLGEACALIEGWPGVEALWIGADLSATRSAAWPGEIDAPFCP